VFDLLSQKVRISGNFWLRVVGNCENFVNVNKWENLIKQEFSEKTLKKLKKFGKIKEIRKF
jgi:hypothetical protein